MATELIQNLIPSINQTTQQNNQHLPNIEEVDLNKKRKWF